MGRNKGSIIMFFIVGLAVIGLISSLVNNPGRFLISILVMVGVAFVIFMIMRAVLNRRGMGSGQSDEMKKYKKAVKQSKMKYNKDKQKPVVKKRTSSLSNKSKIKKKRRHSPHLTVIEGKKGTDKNDRASN